MRFLAIVKVREINLAFTEPVLSKKTRDFSVPVLLTNPYTLFLLADIVSNGTVADPSFFMRILCYLPVELYGIPFHISTRWSSTSEQSTA
jgi:hypothetical protein